MTSKLAGKVALVTGGRPASASASPSISPRKARECLSSAAASPSSIRQLPQSAAVPRPCGATPPISPTSTTPTATIKAQAGHIDVLAVNAGVYEFGTFGEITEEHFDKTFNTNVRGLRFAVQKALPLLVRGSSVILTGSIASIKGFPPSRCTMRQRPRCDHSRAAGSPTSRGATSASTC
jgi:NAD(P)-dependent dehydrogenase (short-subunit alcohol dehydrogenase family)